MNHSIKYSESISSRLNELQQKGMHGFALRFCAAAQQVMAEQNIEMDCQEYLSNLIAEISDKNSKRRRNVLDAKKLLSGEIEPDLHLLINLSSYLNVNYQWIKEGRLPIKSNSEDTLSPPQSADIFRDTFGGRLTTLCQKNGLDKADIIKLTNAGRSTVFKWFTNKSEPSNHHLIILAECFEVSIDWLLTGKNSLTLPQPVQPINGDLNMTSDRELTVKELIELLDKCRKLRLIMATFKFRIDGDHLYDPDNSISIPDGALVHVKTKWLTFPAGRVVLVAIQDGKSIETGIYSPCGESVKLTPINKAYAPYEMQEDDRVIGVVTSYTKII